MNSLVKNATNDDADTRMYAVRALREVILMLGLAKIPMMKHVIDTLFKALEDYSVDRRGDIGKLGPGRGHDLLQRYHSLLDRHERKRCDRKRDAQYMTPE